MWAEPKANTRGLPTLPALASPLNGIVEIAEPDQFRLSELIHRALRVRDDPCDVTTDRDASYFGGRAERAQDPIRDWHSCSTAQQQRAPSVRGA
jgi:hypothetical protein